MQCARIKKQLTLLEGIEDAEALFSDDISWRKGAPDTITQ
jgi:hypothetical protein